MDALPLLEKLVLISPDDFNPYLGLASIKKMLGRGVPLEYINKACQLISGDDWYNPACLESILGNLDTAFDHLTKAAQEKSFDKAWAWEDPDLQWIRDDPRFLEIVGPKPEK